MTTIFGYNHKELENMLMKSVSMLHSVKHFAETTIHEYEEGALKGLQNTHDYFAGEYETFKSFYNLICNLESHLDFSIKEEHDKIIDFINESSKEVKEL